MHQELSDGMIGFNHCRKIQHLPFPFAPAQVEEFFVVTLLPIVPCLMISFVESLPAGLALTFGCNLCFAGLYQAARVLEDPFAFEPNDLPLRGLTAIFNESLLSARRVPANPNGW
jgi:predicted membrane chloride channel (bestrophin family)